MNCFLVSHFTCMDCGDLNSAHKCVFKFIVVVSQLRRCVVYYDYDQ